MLRWNGADAAHQMAFRDLVWGKTLEVACFGKAPVYSCLTNKAIGPKKLALRSLLQEDHYEDEPWKQRGW